MTGSFPNLVVATPHVEKGGIAPVIGAWSVALFTGAASALVESMGEAIAPVLISN